MSVNIEREGTRWRFTVKLHDAPIYFEVGYAETLGEALELAHVSYRVLERRRECDRGTTGLDAVIARLKVHGGKVHTFRAGNVGTLIGADWTLEEVRECFERHGVGEARGMAAALRHELVSVDDVGPVLFATRDE